MQGFFVTDQRTNQQADYRSSSCCMCVWCLYLWSMILDLDTCVYDIKCLMHISTSRCCMYEWCMYVFILCRSVSLVCMMHVSIIFDLWPQCMYVLCAYVWCTYINDPGAWSWCMHVSIMYVPMMRLKFCHQRTNGPTDGRTNKAILGVGCRATYCAKTTIHLMLYF